MGALPHARQPVPPAERATDVPPAVSGIIMRLLAKTAEQRYQTAAGVERDLRRCLTQWEAEHRIDDFRLGEHETPDRLSFPRRCTDESARSRRSSPRSIGSSRPARRSWCWCPAIPASASRRSSTNCTRHSCHRAAVRVRQVRSGQARDPVCDARAGVSESRPPPARNQRRRAGRLARGVRRRVGPERAVDDRPCPRTEADYRRAAAGPELPPSRRSVGFSSSCSGSFGCSRGRSIRSRFSRRLAVARHGHPRLPRGPADAVRRPALLVIGAFDNEVGPDHPLARKLEAIRDAGAVVHEIALAPLAREDVAQLVADALHSEPERVATLAQLVCDKTAGNPFFTTQFLTALGDEGLLTSIMRTRAGRGISIASAPSVTPTTWRT